MVETDGEESGEADKSVAASIEAEDKLIEMGLEMSSSPAVIDAERPGLDVAAIRADEAVRSAGFNQIIGASTFIGEALLNLQKGVRIAQHARRSELIRS